MPTRTEEAASKVMGGVKATKATIEGLHGVFKKLAEEHGQVTALLLRVKMSSDADVRRNLFPEIRSQLLAHEKGELREVYPVFMDHPDLQGRAHDHDREAGELEQLLDRHNGTAFEEKSWKDMFDRLVELVSHHTEEEENEYFPAGERVLGQEEAERLESRYEAAKAEAMRQPH